MSETFGGGNASTWNYCQKCGYVHRDGEACPTPGVTPAIRREDVTGLSSYFDYRIEIARLKAERDEARMWARKLYRQDTKVTWYCCSCGYEEKDGHSFNCKHQGMREKEEQDG